MSEEQGTPPKQEAAADPGTDPNWPRDLDGRLHRVGKASMEVTIMLGRTRLSLEEILNAEPGTLIELEKLAGESVDILVNGTPFGKGEIFVMAGENFGVRITELFKPEQMQTV